jgi:hypothetical protein
MLAFLLGCEPVGLGWAANAENGRLCARPSRCRSATGGDRPQLTLDAVLLSVKYAVPAMRRAGGGSIIITSSVAGLPGSAGLAGYCATREAYACSRRRSRWSAQQKLMGSGSIRFIRVSLTRRFGRSYQGQAGATVPIDPNEVAKAGCRSAGWTGSGHREWRAIPRLRRF